MNEAIRDALRDTAEFLKDIAPELDDVKRSWAYAHSGRLEGILRGDVLVNGKEWKCRNCHQHNSGWAKVCGLCGTKKES